MPSGKRGRTDLSPLHRSIDRSATLSFVAAGNYHDDDDDVLIFPLFRRERARVFRMASNSIGHSYLRISLINTFCILGCFITTFCYMMLVFLSDVTVLAFSLNFRQINVAAQVGLAIYVKNEAESHWVDERNQPIIHASSCLCQQNNGPQKKYRQVRDYEGDLPLFNKVQI